MPFWVKQHLTERKKRTCACLTYDTPIITECVTFKRDSIRWCEVCFYARVKKIKKKEKKNDSNDVVVYEVETVDNGK